MTYSKLDAAKIQLDRAIDCYFENDHICAITLAGASEDILNSLIELHNSEAVGAFKHLLNFYRKTNNTNIQPKEFSRKIANQVRNWLKHGKDDADSECEIGERDSIFMLMRAVPAYRKLTNGQLTVNMKKFSDYYESNKARIESLFNQTTSNSSP
jgi:hypothetical protein